jgi:RNA polymerase sigma-70 factor (ECF subfamily)
MDDRQIIDLFFARSEKAITELSDKYGRLCHQIANNILNNTQDAEECVNDAYLGAWNTIPPQKPNPLQTYICKIVRNISITRYHANTAQKRNSSYDVALDELENCLYTSDNPENLLQAKELTGLLNRYLSNLDVRSRVMFVRRYWYGDSINKIAESFGMRPNTVTVQLSRILGKMRKFLIQEGYRI